MTKTPVFSFLLVVPFFVLGAIQGCGLSDTGSDHVMQEFHRANDSSSDSSQSKPHHIPMLLNRARAPLPNLKKCCSMAISKAGRSPISAVKEKSSLLAKSLHLEAVLPDDRYPLGGGRTSHREFQYLRRSKKNQWRRIFFAD